MKRNLYTAVFLLVILFLSPLKAQEREYDFDESCIERLLDALQNDNDGVRKCAAYLSGSYRIKETVPRLVNLLETDKCENVRSMAAHALFRIKCSQSIEAIYKAALYDPNDSIKNLCRAMCLEMNHKNFADN